MRLAPLLAICALGAAPAPASAQDVDVFADPHTPFAGYTRLVSIRSLHVESDGSWLMTGIVSQSETQQFGDDILVEDGVALITQGDVLPDGKTVAEIKWANRDDTGRLLWCGRTTPSGNAIYIDGVRTLTQGDSLDFVTGFPAGRNLINVHYAELLGGGSRMLLTGNSSGNRDFVATVELDAAGNVVGGDLVALETEQAPVGGNIEVIVREWPAVAANEAGDVVWVARTGNNQIMRVYFNQTQIARDNTPAGDTANNWDISLFGNSFAVSPSGQWALMAPTVSPSGDFDVLLTSSYGDIAATGDIDYAITPYPFDTLLSSRINVGFLPNEQLVWVADWRDTTTPEREFAIMRDAEKLVVPKEHLAHDVPLDFVHRISADPARMAVDPTGRYVIAGFESFATDEMIFARIDLAGTPDAPCQIADDGYEPNDMCVTPTPLTVGDLLGLRASKTSPDWYSVTVLPGEQLNLEARFDAGACDIDVFVWDDLCNTPTLLASSTRVSGDLEQVVVPNTTAAPIELRVELAVAQTSIGDCGSYELDWYTGSQDVCTPPWPEDGFEDNDDCLAAVPLGPGTYTGLYTNEFDEDWWAFDVPPGATLDILLEFDQASGQIWPVLYDGCDPAYLLFGPGDGIADQESASWTNHGDRLVRVTLNPLVNGVFPFDCQVYDLTVELDAPVIGARYCSPAAQNSTGIGAGVFAAGSATAGDNDVTLLAQHMPPNQFGYFLTSMTQGLTLNPGGSQGDLCLGGGIGRYVAFVGSTGASGTLTLGLDLTQTPTPNGAVPVMAGQTWNFTCWYRDFNPTPTSNFTDGISIAFQ